jgi:RecA-family ATPase
MSDTALSVIASLPPPTRVAPHLTIVTSEPEIPAAIDLALINLRRDYERGDPCQYLRRMAAVLAEKLAADTSDPQSRLLAERAIITSLQEFAAAHRIIPNDGKHILDAATLKQPMSFVTTTLPFVSPAQWDGQPIPEQEWLVEQVLPMGVPSLLSGDGGVGKTTVMAQLAVAVAAGESDWLGWKISKPGPVIYFSAEESSDEFRRRIAASAAHYGCRLSALKGLHLLCMPGEDAALGSPHVGGEVRATKLLESVQAVATAIRPSLVVIEAAADVFAGNENDRSEVRQFIALLRRLGMDSSAAVVLLAHPSVQGMMSGRGTSGSTAWSNSVRSRLYLAKRRADDAGPDIRELTVEKANYGPEGQKVRLRWQRGVYVVDAGLPARDIAVAESGVDDLYLRCLDTATAQGRRVRPNTGKEYAPAVFARMPIANGVTSKAFAGAQERLFGSGKIEAVTTGSPSRRSTSVVRKAT